MTKEELNAITQVAKDETKNVLQTVFDTLNHGQQKKLLKDEKVKAQLDLYGVQYAE